MVLENLPIGLNIATIAGVVGIGALVMAMQTSSGKKDKKKQLNMFGLLGVAIFILPLLISVPVLTDNLSSGTSTTQPTTQPTGTLAGCNVEDTTVTVSSVDEFTQVATGGTHAYRVNDNPILTVADAGTFTASPGDSVQILFGNETESATTNSYAGALETFNIGCKGTQTLSTLRPRNGTITIEVFNEEGNLVDNAGATSGTSGENESLAAGDVVTLTFKLKGSFERGYPGGVMVVEFNGTTSTSTIDDIIIDIGGSTETSVPSVYSTTMGTESRTKAYIIPPIAGNEILAGSIVIDADDSNDPVVGGITSVYTGNPLLTLYPNDYFVNKGIFDGPDIVDEDDVVTFNHVSTFQIGID